VPIPSPRARQPRSKESQTARNRNPKSQEKRHKTPPTCKNGYFGNTNQFTTSAAWRYFTVDYFGPRLIPNAVMHLYKFGHFKAASLVLKNEGCAIAREHGLIAWDHGLQEGAVCHFADVMICSRLGGTYYVELRKADTPARFTIPAQDVLSWRVADEQLPDAGCNSRARSDERRKEAYRIENRS
jgi:hypothetical protein